VLTEVLQARVSAPQQKPEQQELEQQATLSQPQLLLSASWGVVVLRPGKTANCQQERQKQQHGQHRGSSRRECGATTATTPASSPTRARDACGAL
jgi:hypothetical protein